MTNTTKNEACQCTDCACRSCACTKEAPRCECQSACQCGSPCGCEAK